jgi:hypothetical protein
MKSAEVQKAIYTALTTANISGIKHIRDTPIAKPSDDDFPFIEIGAGQTIAADAGGDNGIEEYIDLHCYSRARGQKEIKVIMEAIYNALHHVTLSVTGRTTSFCWFEDGRTLTDADGLTRHGVQTFKINHRS